MILIKSPKVENTVTQIEQIVELGAGMSLLRKSRRRQKLKLRVRLWKKRGLQRERLTVGALRNIKELVQLRAG